MRLLEYFFFSPRPPMNYVSSIVVTTIPYVVLPLIIYAVVRFYQIFITKKEVSVKRELLYAFTIAYISVVVKLTIIPDWSLYRNLDTQEIEFYSGISHHLPINLVPLKNILAFLHKDVHVNEEDISLVVVLNLVGRSLLMSPIGFILPALFPRENSWKKVILIGVGCSFTIEVIQFFIGKAADIDDVLLSVIGIVIGYGIYCAMKCICEKISSK